MLTNAEITSRSRKTLKGSWKLPIFASAIYMSVMLLLGCIPLIGWIGALALSGPLSLGYCTAYLTFVRKGDMRLSQLFDGFRHFVNAFLAYIIRLVYIILWSLLLIVPGIVAALGYSMTFFILADNPGAEGLDALAMSRQMMQGRRWKLFCLGCRFIGWSLLGVLSLGIGFVWIVPYFQTSLTLFYEDLKGGHGSRAALEPASA
jgi:uncharacterized membrane protein